MIDFQFRDYFIYEFIGDGKIVSWYINKLSV